MISKLGKLGNATVFISTEIDHDTIWISPKEGKMILDLIELLNARQDLKTIQESMEEPMLIVDEIINGRKK